METPSSSGKAALEEGPGLAEVNGFILNSNAWCVGMDLIKLASVYVC